MIGMFYFDFLLPIAIVKSFNESNKNILTDLKYVNTFISWHSLVLHSLKNYMQVSIVRHIVGTEVYLKIIFWHKFKDSDANS